METRANFVLIGIFTLAVIAAAFGFVLWFQNLHSTTQRTPLRIIFEGAASGLRNGGEVVSVKLDNPKRVVALAMVENIAPIRKDTQVGLEFQGLTGVAAIALKGGDEAAPAVPLDTDGVPVLTADPELLRDISESIRATLNNVNRLVADNQDTLKGAMKNVETFTATLAKNSEVIDGIMLKIDSVMGKADGVMGKADSVVARTDNILLGLDALAGGKDGGELTAAVKSFHELTENLDKRSGALMLDGRRTLADISRAVNNLDRNPTRLLFGASSGTPAAAPAPAAPPASVAPPRRRQQAQ
jgi:phospholipid/cholesterol/gamma-HCH transport system substrate-binding protein